jgi:hypothetical protein
MFNLAIDSKLRSCDVVAIRVEDGRHAHRIHPVFLSARVGLFFYIRPAAI